MLKVFEQVSRGTGINIGMVCGQVSLEKESAMLFDSSSYPPCSGVDILIATSGRLVEHLNRLRRNAFLCYIYCFKGFLCLC